MEAVTAERVVKALMERPKLLDQVRTLLLRVRGCGPWMNTGKRFGDRDMKNVWGLPKFPKNREERKRFAEHPHDSACRKFMATVRPTEEWGKEVGGTHPGLWFWNVSTGNPEENDRGVERTRRQAMLRAEAALRSFGWVVTGLRDAE